MNRPQRPGQIMETEGCDPLAEGKRGAAGPWAAAVNGRGDLYVHVQVKVPAKLTREQRKLFKQLKETLPAENKPSERGLLDKVKDHFV